MVDMKVVQAAVAHAAQEAPRESCGLVVARDNKAVYVPCRNIASGEREFAIAPEDWAAVEDSGEILMVVHSHYGVPPEPSHADLVECEKSGLPWLIVNWPVGSHKVLEPSGFVLPLRKRQFCHGVIDCFTLIRDYYDQVLNIKLADPVRQDYWWERGEDLYLDNYKDWGFVRIPFEDLREHDVVLMTMQSQVPNHGAIYLGNSRILHHLRGRLSSEDVFGGYWVRNTHSVYRHKELL